MLRMEEWMDIKMLKQQGHSIRKICELTGHSRNTVRKVLREKAPQVFNQPERKSLLDEFKPCVEQRYQQCALSCVRLLDETRPMGYRGKIDSLRRFVRISECPPLLNVRRFADRCCRPEPDFPNDDLQTDHRPMKAP